MVAEKLLLQPAMEQERFVSCLSGWQETRKAMVPDSGEETSPEEKPVHRPEAVGVGLIIGG